MPIGDHYRRYAEECLRAAQYAKPVTRAHLLRVAHGWSEIADQTDTYEAANRFGMEANHLVRKSKPSTSGIARKAYAAEPAKMQSS
jgi:hypothetical protein